MQKARRHGTSPLRPLVSTRFQVLFHSPVGVLFTFPSRYWFTIGLSGVFSLTRWCWQIPTGRLRPRGTQDTARPASLTYTWLSHAMAPVFHQDSTSLCCNHIAVLQPRSCRNMNGLGSFPFARHYSGNHCYFLLLRLLRCFSSAGLLIICDMSSTCRVAPFGNPRINSYVLIPVAYRS